MNNFDVMQTISTSYSFGFGFVVVPPARTNLFWPNVPGLVFCVVSGAKAVLLLRADVLFVDHIGLSGSDIRELR